MKRVIKPLFSIIVYQKELFVRHFYDVAHSFEEERRYIEQGLFLKLLKNNVKLLFAIRVYKRTIFSEYLYGSAGNHQEEI